MRTIAWVCLLAGTAYADDEPTGETIEIIDHAPDATDAPSYTMSAADVAATPGAANDALRAAATLPSAARIPYSFGGLVLRGMSPRDTRVLIDGVEIPIAFHFGGISAVFPTALLGDMRVIPSGFDVSIGRTQGGVVELVSRRPRGDRWRVGGELSLLHSAVDLEGPAPGDGAFLAGIRRSYLDVLAKPFTDRNDIVPSYLDGQLRAVWGPLAVYALGSLDQIANEPAAATPNDPYAAGYVDGSFGFARVGAEYRAHELVIAPFVGTNILSIYTKDYHGGPMLTEQQLTRHWYQFGGRAEWRHDTAHGFLRGGLDIAGGYLGRVTSDLIADDAIDPDVPLPRNTVLWTNAAAWFETRRAWDGFAVRPGLRVERYGLGNETVVDPRLAAEVALGDRTTLRTTLGRYHQPPSPAHFDEFLDNLDAKSSYVDQSTLGIEWLPEPAITAAATAFFDEGRKTLVDVPGKTQTESVVDLDRVIRELVEEQVGIYGYQANIGRERSYGLELAVGYASDRVRLLASYTWSRSLRTYADGVWQPYVLDQPLRLNALAAAQLGTWSVGARISVASGNPVHLIPAGSTDDPEHEPPAQLMRLPTFWQLDVRIDRELGHNLHLFLDIQNALYNDNVEERANTLRSDELDPMRTFWAYHDTHGIPIIPLVGLVLVPDA